MTPIRTGFYVFTGTRRTGRTMIEIVQAPVQVIEVHRFGKPTELAVKMLGRQQAFRLEAYEGEWQRLEVGSP